MSYGANPQDWQRFLDQGLEADLLPVVSDPSVPIHKQSRLPEDNRGKVPSRVAPDGTLVGMPGWSRDRHTAADVRRWMKDDRLGVCIQTREVRAVDVDIADPTISADVRETVEMMLGALPCRSRPNSGKLLLAFRLPGTYLKRILETPHGRIEFLANGQHFVAAGTHPSGVRYEWNDTALPWVDLQDFEQMWAALEAQYGKPTETRDRTATHSGEVLGLTDAEIRAALSVLDPDMPYDQWCKTGMALHYETRGEGLSYWQEWSANGVEYPGDEELGYKWQSFGRYTGPPVTAGTLVQMAAERGVYVGPAAPAAATEFDVLDKPPTPAVADPVPLDWGALPEEPPEPRFVIPGWMPENTVTLLAAHGGTGKSFMSLYIGLCLATGRHPFALGEDVPRVRVVLYSAEDDLTAMQWRLRRYMRLMGITPAELQGWLLVLDATASDNVLFTRGRNGAGKTTKRFAWLREQCQAFGAAVLIFDNASDGFDGNEVERAAVRQFISALKRAAPTTLLLSHVDAASSMAQPGEGKGYSGSTAWNNSVRSRWLMARYENDDIVLSLQKSNYARTGSEAAIRWSDDRKLFEVVNHRIGVAKANDHRALLLGMLHKLTVEMGKDVSPAKTSQTSAFNLMKDMPGFPNGLKTGDVAREVQAWIAEGLAREEHYSRGNRHEGQRLVLTAAGEAAIFSTVGQSAAEF